MISTLLNFKANKVKIINTTNKYLYFSDGKFYNKKEFLSACKVLQMLVNYCSTSAKITPTFNKELELLFVNSRNKKRQVRLTKNKNKKEKLDLQSKQSNFHNPYNSTKIIPYGKYKGQMVKNVSDYQYLQWLIEQSSFCL